MLSYSAAPHLEVSPSCSSEDAGRPAMIHIGRIYRLSTGYEVTIKIVRDTPAVDNCTRLLGRRSDRQLLDVLSLIQSRRVGVWERHAKAAFRTINKT